MKVVPITEGMYAEPNRRPVVGYGIAWDPEWIGVGRLRVRGYRAAHSWPALATSEFAALVATVDGALVDDGWTAFERHAVRTALARLYARDIPEILADLPLPDVPLMAPLADEPSPRR